MHTSGLLSEKVHNLENIKLFQGLNPTELHSVCQAGRYQRIKTATFLFHQDDPANILYVLIQGQVKLTHTGPEGHQLLVRMAHPGEDFGAIATLSGLTYPLSAQAVEMCVVIAWDELTIKRLLQTYPKIALNALQLVVERFKELQQRYRELASERVERRIARALLRLLDQAGRRVDRGLLINLALSRQDLAEMTGTTLYTVSRILSSWEKEGLVDIGRERVIIRQPRNLEAIADDLSPVLLAQYSA